MSPTDHDLADSQDPERREALFGAIDFHKHVLAADGREVVETAEVFLGFLRADQ